MNNNDSVGSKRKGNSKRTLAKKADRFDCYQRSVQNPDHEIDFFDQAYRDAFDKKPLSLREDFCGTFAVCCEWVKTNKKRTAVGVDLCSETLQWGEEHNLKPLTKSQKERIQLLQQDVRTPSETKFDILAAQNFSFWIFKTRKEVVNYFEIAHANLNSDGLMVMDMMGGGDCYVEDRTDKRKIKNGKNGFVYHWTQETFNPVTADATFSISFKFKDGSKLKKAFEYDWRFWTIPEVLEMLAEAGFSASHVYWEQEQEDDNDDDEETRWSRETVVPSDACWISYLVALK